MTLSGSQIVTVQIVTMEEIRVQNNSMYSNSGSPSPFIAQFSQDKVMYIISNSQVTYQRDFCINGNYAGSTFVPSGSSFVSGGSVA